ncbi:hypothetical protein BASA50_000068 [Batrachochytrium salamandrivorans]|uniref:Ribose-5-phosphate isomerase n=1 Tax=Batrachochytrium salamandrivorans TaxID=1357716 RepID=A0ABQ8EV03_9FUNG|nr:hypothetical protein BASA50_000068 [Batrachochytrium salamandrivorans]
MPLVCLQTRLTAKLLDNSFQRCCRRLCFIRSVASTPPCLSLSAKMPTDIVEQAKQLASFRAIDERVSSTTKVIGIGSGSTIVYAVQRLGERYKAESLPIQACIATSFQAQHLILDAGLPLGTLNQYPVIDVAFDGADEVDASLNCIKGGGACLLQEKFVASNAKEFYIVADHRKDSEVLCTQWKQGVPIEVTPMVYVAVMLKITAIGGKPTLRMATKKAGPVVTDNGNFVVDADFGQIKDPMALNNQLISIPGIVDTGLFCEMANGAYFGMPDGTVKAV